MGRSLQTCQPLAGMCKTMSWTSFRWSREGWVVTTLTASLSLYFADDAMMRSAFSGAGAQPVWADEPNFLGHSTAYAITGDRYANPSMTDSKLVVAANGSRAGIDWLGDKLRMLENMEAIERNDVAEVIPRTTMARGPQPADVFIHCRFTSVNAAREAGRRLAEVDLEQAASHGIERLAITRVSEKLIV